MIAAASTPERNREDDYFLTEMALKPEVPYYELKRLPDGAALVDALARAQELPRLVLPLRPLGLKVGKIPRFGSFPGR